MTIRLLSERDILSISPYQVPMIVVFNGEFSFLSLLIRLGQKHFSGSHIGWAYQPGLVASQEYILRSRSIKDFFSEYSMTFWYSPKWTIAQRSDAVSEIKSRLNDPIYRRLYDALGIIGQLLGKVWINFPWWHYCSEEVAGPLSRLHPTFNLKHPSVRDLVEWMQSSPDFRIYGHYAPGLSQADSIEERTEVLSNLVELQGVVSK